MRDQMTALWEEVALMNNALHGDPRENPPGGLVNDVKGVRSQLNSMEDSQAELRRELSQILVDLRAIHAQTKRTAMLNERFPSMLYLFYRNASMVILFATFLLQIGVLTSVLLGDSAVQAAIFGSLERTIAALASTIAINALLLVPSVIFTRRSIVNGHDKYD